MSRQADELLKRGLITPTTHARLKMADGGIVPSNSEIEGSITGQGVAGLIKGALGDTRPSDPDAVNPTTTILDFITPGMVAAPAKALMGGARAIGSGAIEAAPRIVGNEVGAVGKDISELVAQKALPMDEASRIARAKAMGFDPETTWYHGTGASFEKFDPSFSKQATGAAQEGYGHYFTTKPEVAGIYASKEGGSIIPAYLKQGKYLTKDDAIKASDRSLFKKIIKAAPDWKDSIVNYGDENPNKSLEMALDLVMNSENKIDALHEIANTMYGGNLDKWAEQLNKNGILGFENKASGVRVVADPSNIRSKFAEFNLAKAKSGELSAGIGGSALLGSQLAGSKAEAKGNQMFSKEQADKMLEKGLITPATYQKITGAQAYADGTPPGGAQISGFDAQMSSQMPSRPTDQEIAALQREAPLSEFEQASVARALAANPMFNPMRDMPTKILPSGMPVFAPEKLATNLEVAQPKTEVPPQVPAAVLGQPQGQIQAQMAPGAAGLTGLAGITMPGEEAARKAMELQYGAATGLAGSEAKALGEAAIREKASHEQFQNIYGNIEARANELRDQLGRAEINPNQLWESSSTGAKIGAVVGMLVAGVGAGLTGRENMAVAQINKAIDRDIEAQKVNLSKKSTLLNSYMGQLQDARAAEYAARAHSLAIADMQLKQAQARAQTPQAQAALEMARATLEQQKAQYQVMLAERIQGAQLMGLGGGEGGIPVQQATYGMLTGKDAPNLVIAPERNKYFMAKTPKEAEEMRKVEAEYGNATALLNELKQYASLGSMMSPTQRARAKSIQEQLPAVLNTINGYTQFTHAHEDYLKKVFSEPGITSALFAPNAATNQLIQDMQRQMEMKRAQLYTGYKPLLSIQPGVK